MVWVKTNLKANLWLALKYLKYKKVKSIQNSQAVYKCAFKSLGENREINGDSSHMLMIITFIMHSISQVLIYLVLCE